MLSGQPFFSFFCTSEGVDAQTWKKHVFLSSQPVLANMYAGFDILVGVGVLIAHGPIKVLLHSHRRSLAIICCKLPLSCFHVADALRRFALAPRMSSPKPRPSSSPSNRFSARTSLESWRLPRAKQKDEEKSAICEGLLYMLCRGLGRL